MKYFHAIVYAYPATKRSLCPECNRGIDIGQLAAVADGGEHHRDCAQIAMDREY